MPNVLTPNAKQQFLTSNGLPAVSYRLFTYAAGTSTKIATKVSPSGADNANPIVLDYRGECNVWVAPNVSYKYVLAPPGADDPPTSPIWTVDNVVSSQLITLYGGVDTGGVNAYILTFTSNFSAYQDGIVIYWIPSNANTGASTINVNGLGAVNIINQNGAALTPGQLIANQIAVIMYKGTGFQLLSSGLASPSAQTIFIARRSVGAGNQTLTNNATTTVIFDTEDTDQGSNYNNATGVFTAPTAGVYQFSSSLLITSNASAGQLRGTPFFSKNNSFALPGYITLTGQFMQEVTGAGGIPASAQGFFAGVATFQLAAGDTVRINVNQPNNGGGAFSLTALQGYNNFAGYKLA